MTLYQPLESVNKCHNGTTQFMLCEETDNDEMCNYKQQLGNKTFQRLGNTSSKIHELLSKSSRAHGLGSIVDMSYSLQQDSGIQELKRTELKRTVLNSQKPVHSSIQEQSSDTDSPKEFFLCGICGTDFTRKLDLVTHLQEKHDVKQHLCGLCGASFQEESELSDHIQTHVKESVINYDYTCDLCGEKFERRGQREAHVKNQHFEKTKPNSCDICSKRFAVKHSLKAHVMVHKGEFNFKCEICNRSFIHQGTYKQHMNNKHNTDTAKQSMEQVRQILSSSVIDNGSDLTVKDSHCNSLEMKNNHGNLTDLASDLPDSHESSFITQNNKSYKLQDDDHLIFNIKVEPEDEFSSHINDVGEIRDMFITGSNGDSQLQTTSVFCDKEVSDSVIDLCGDNSNECPYCGKTFATKSYVKTHMKIHTQDKRYACEICGKIFNGNYNLERHMRIHTGAKPFTCGVCSRNFRDVSVLQKHLRIHTNVKPYVCDTCGNCFKQSATLQKHIRTHTNEPNPFTCSFCGVEVNDWATLRRHIKTVHHGILPCSCEICGKSFRDKTNLTRHMRTHEEDVSRSICEVCGKAYKALDCLKKHIKRKHQQLY